MHLDTVTFRKTFRRVVALSNLIFSAVCYLLCNVTLHWSAIALVFLIWVSDKPLLNQCVAAPMRKLWDEKPIVFTPDFASTSFKVAANCPLLIGLLYFIKRGPA